MENNNVQKPLTLDSLASYNQDVLFPWLKENLVAKKEFTGFKNRTLTSQDKIVKKLDILLSEKISGKQQEKREKKFWAIIVKALQEHRILSSRDLQEISQLEIF
jgi:hypothetical protein